MPAPGTLGRPQQALASQWRSSWDSHSETRTPFYFVNAGNANTLPLWCSPFLQIASIVPLGFLLRTGRMAAIGTLALEYCAAQEMYFPGEENIAHTCISVWLVRYLSYTLGF